ncbi:MAG: extracellular solute-binding protein [Chloroflexia bacterium]|nr:extracellular solute-binding protein [Chloroflexia bacterium]MDQ3411628.1 extracellular solute-binding protein [Chloroflexota bacterium]
MSQTLSRRRAIQLAGAGVAGAAAWNAIPLRTAAQTDQVQIEIALPGFFADPEHPAMALIEAFNATDVGVQATGANYGASYEEVMQRTQANISAQIGPAIAVTGWKYGAFADAALAIADLQEVGGPEVDPLLARYYPWVVDFLRFNDKIIGLPFSTSNLVIFYNKNLFAQAGLDPEQPPRTWEEVAAFARQLQAETRVEAPLIGEMNEFVAQYFVQYNGGRILDDQGQAVFDSAAGIGGIEVWSGLTRDGLHVVIEGSQRNPTFLGGNAAMNFGSITGIRSYGANAAFDLGTGPFPAIGEQPRQPAGGGNFLGVYAREAEQREGAWAFLQFVNSPAGAEIWNQSGYLSLIPEDNLEPIPGQEPAYAQMEAGMNIETMWPGPRGLEAMNIFNEWIARIVSGDVELATGMHDAKDAVAALLP